MLQAFVLAALTLSGRVQIHHVLGMALVLGVCTAFDVAARQSLYIHLVGKEDLLSAISLNSATFNSARVVGPALGGLVVAHLGEGLCFLLNGFSFLAVLAALAAMHLNEPRYAGTENPFARLRGGFRLAAGSPPLRTAFLLIGAMTLAVAPVTALGPLFADGFFHRGAQGLGWLTGALGLGAIAGTLTLASSRGGTLLPHAVMQALCVAGAALLIFAASPSYWLCLAVMPVLGMCIFRSNAATNTMLQMRVPEGFRGRIMGLYSATVIGMLPIGSLLAGALAAHIGPRWTVACGSLLALAGALYAARHRHRMRSWLEESPAASVTPGPAGLL
jgi:predicted MFS family arabinose efflux permease